MIRNYLRTAIRTLTRNGSISLLNILGLSAGMTAAVLIFLWVDNELSYDAYHPDAGSIYRITSHVTSSGFNWATGPHPLAEAIHNELPSVETVTSMQPGYNTILRVNGELLIEKHSAFVDSNWFRLFHYDFLQGSPAGFFSQPYSLILTESKAKKYFGNKNPIGLTIHKDTVDYRVAGVVRDNPANSSFQLDILMPMQALLSNPERRLQASQWGGYNHLLFLKLRPMVDPTRTGRLISAIVHKNKPADSKNFFTLTPLTSMHLETGITSIVIAHGSRNTVYIFSILGAFLLLIACINYVNLTTARATLRAKEVGIRKVVGAGKGSLFGQFIIESLLISGIALACTLALIQLAMPLFRELTDTNFPSPFASAETWKLLGLTLLSATVLNGVYPALLLSSFRPLNTLKGNREHRRLRTRQERGTMLLPKFLNLKFKDVYLRKSLVVLQFTFSIILVASTLIIQRQLRYIQQGNPGYDRSEVFYFSLPNTLFKGATNEEAATLTNTIKAELLSQTSVAGVAAASESIVQVGNGNVGGSDWDGRDKAFTPMTYELSADEDYNKVLHLELQQGRWFDPRRPMDQHNFILNETAVKELNIRRPVLGQRFTFDNDTGKIIGIVKDFHFASLHEKIAPLILLNRDSWRSTFFIKTRPANAATAVAMARSIFQRYAHDRPFDYTFLDQEFDSLYRTDSKASTLIRIFSIIAILISCLGLLGLATFTAQQRIREIGIRKVLGATVSNILTLLLRDFIRLVLFSVGIATPIAWWAMHRWLQGFAYHTSLNAWLFVAAGFLAILIALLAVGAQSVRAATSNPVKNLRTD
jgi:predicted permease